MKRIYLLLTATLLGVYGLSAQKYVAPVTMPEIPDTLFFAGERVPLENYDTRESLEREMLGTGYMHSATFRNLLHATRFFPILEPSLKKKGIPEGC